MQQIRDQLIADEHGEGYSEDSGRGSSPPSSVGRKAWDLAQKNRLMNPSPASVKHVGKQYRSTSTKVYIIILVILQRLYRSKAL